VAGPDLGASVLARLLAMAKRQGDDHNLLLNRFALERLLHRLSISSHADGFLLKGALLFALWYDQPHRPTRDADLLGFGASDAERLVRVFRDITGLVLDDGMAFDPDSVRAEPIREDSFYGGLRVRLIARIGSARCNLQVDVGFGDAVTPQPETVRYPTLLSGFASPVLRAYPVYTVIAEKYHAMVVLGLANSRMKDFYDLAVIAARTELDGATLAKAIAATFMRRSTALPIELPMALTPAFGIDPAKQRQWMAFLARNRLVAVSLADTVGLLYTVLWPATQVAAIGSAATARWLPKESQWV
jgi:hypothetical protein